MISDDLHRILPRYFARQQEAERQRRIGRIVLETGEAAPARVIAGATPAGDWRKLRGIPCVSRGVAGVKPGTDPYLALAAKESRI